MTLSLLLTFPLETQTPCFTSRHSWLLITPLPPEWSEMTIHKTCLSCRPRWHQPQGSERLCRTTMHNSTCLFNFSLSWERVLMLWKTSCWVPVAKEHLQETPVYVPTVCGHQRPVLCHGVLGGQYINGLQIGKADQAGWFHGWHEAGLFSDSRWEEDTGQTIDDHGWCQSPFTHCHQQSEEPVQLETAPSRKQD